MNEIDDILKAASEPLPHTETPRPEPPPRTETPRTEVPRPEPPPSPEPPPAREIPVPRPAPVPTYPTGCGDNAMETVLRCMATILLVVGTGYSIYLASEIANMGRRFGGDGTMGFIVFLAGTGLSFLIWALLFVLSNISINARASKHLLAQIATSGRAHHAE